ncbi:hypothetical protein [Leifsonia aquatica]|uniref:hypothetical protein n=1 Tax=Leifsonia aquatica TaxID=144185 RepID=UPI000468B2C6|nr:hypothetical protein [Leifsonia aquatica]
MAHRRLVAACAALAVAVLPLMVGGCARTPTCFPEAVTATPSTVTAGSTVTVSSTAASCDLGYSSAHTYTLRLTHRESTTQAVNAPVKPDGSFTATVPVPADFPHGTAYIAVTGTAYDDCADSGSGSCAGYGTTIDVE